MGETITTPAGFTITPESDGSYRICDPRSHCLRTNTLWEAQQRVQWAEAHHQGLPSAKDANEPRSAPYDQGQ